MSAAAGVVIAGGGLAGQRCAETLRRSGYDGRVVMVCGEHHLPYDRPPLSKEGLHDPLPEQLALRDPRWYEKNAVELVLGVEARALEVSDRTLELADRSRVRYEHLLIATGARPRLLPMFARYANVHTLRTLEDAAQLRSALADGGPLLVLGAGFIGQEVAAAARSHGIPTTIVEAAPAPLAGLLGPELGAWFSELHRERGVELVLGEQVAEVHGEERVRAVTLTGGSIVECEHVVVGVGVEPDVGWLAGSPLAGAGVRVDSDGCSAVPCVYAAGDAAAVWEPLLRRHVLGGHWETAARLGARAAKAMLGLDPGPLSVSSFWSDLYGTRVQYLGHASLADGMRLDGDPRTPDFSATFTAGDRAVAVLLAGRPQALPRARALLAPTYERSQS